MGRDSFVPVVNLKDDENDIKYELWQLHKNNIFYNFKSLFKCLCSKDTEYTEDEYKAFIMYQIFNSSIGAEQKCFALMMFGLLYGYENLNLTKRRTKYLLQTEKVDRSEGNFFEDLSKEQQKQRLSDMRKIEEKVTRYLAKHLSEHKNSLAEDLKKAINQYIFKDKHGNKKINLPIMDVVLKENNDNSGEDVYEFLLNFEEEKSEEEQVDEHSDKDESIIPALTPIFRKDSDKNGTIENDSNKITDVHNNSNNNIINISIDAKAIAANQNSSFIKSENDIVEKKTNKSVTKTHSKSNTCFGIPKKRVAFFVIFGIIAICSMFLDKYIERFGAVKEIYIPENEIFLYEGDTYKIKAETMPYISFGSQLNYSSVDDNVVTVSTDGVIKTLDEYSDNFQKETDVIIRSENGVMKKIHVYVQPHIDLELENKKKEIEEQTNFETFVLAAYPESEWQYTLNTNIGDSIFFLLKYVNNSDVDHDNIIVKAIFPDNMEYVANSTEIYNSEIGEWVPIESNEILYNGINIGSCPKNDNLYVEFEATIVDHSLQLGTNQLVMWSETISNIGKRHAYAPISVTK